MAMIPSEELKLEACPKCGRTFNATSLAKHVPVCYKAKTKRAVFDSSRQRWEGNDLVKYTPPPALAKRSNAAEAQSTATDCTTPDQLAADFPPADAAATRAPKMQAFETHAESLLAPLASAYGTRPVETQAMDTRASSTRALVSPTTVTLPAVTAAAAATAATATGARAAAAPSQPKRGAAKKVATVSASAGHTPPAGDQLPRRRFYADRTLERCPHCERSFNRKAYEAHVAWCKERTITNAFSSTRNNEERERARQRMQARISYRPPSRN